VTSDSANVSTHLILVVEDDQDSRVILALTLQFEGYHVLEAANGREALTLCLRHRPSLILLDLMMPVMTGEEFRAQQLTTRDIRHIPVVVVSARHDTDTAAQRLAARAWLEKPVDFDNLLRVVRSTLEKV
jgi:CheY-like chemotaxis protein